MIVHSDEIVGKMITYADKHRRSLMPDLFYLSDYINGLDREKDKVVKILDSFDQSKEGVKIIRGELNL